MKNVFVSYEIAFELKQLGFDEPCFGYFDCERDFQFLPNKSKFLECEFAAPTFSQVFTWFRENFELVSWIYTSDNIKFYYSILKNKRFMVSDYYVVTKTKSPAKPYDTYEEAELACLLKLIEVLKNKNMQRIEVDPTKVIEGKPIMRKETGIEYLADIYDDVDFARPDVFRTAYFKQLESIDEFSLWLVIEDWMPNYGSGLDRGKWERVGDDLKTMSELYQIFLEQNKKQNEY